MYTPNWTTFRAMPPFKAFSNATTYPDSVLDYYFTQAQYYLPLVCNTINGVQIFNTAEALNILYFYVAHLITLDNALNPDNAQGAVHNGVGIATSVSASGGLSVGLVPPPAKSQLDWWLNQTPFGERILMWLSRLLAGGFTIGGSLKRFGL